MPRMQVNVGHQLDPDEAVRRLRSFLELVKQAYGHRVSQLEETWEYRSGSFSFQAMGFKTSGTVEIDHQEVRVVGQLPLAAIVFRGQIEQALRENLAKALNREIA